MNACCKKLNINFILKAVIAFIITFILSSTVLSQAFMVKTSSSVITITDTATKNRNSAGTDVRIKSIKLDGKEIPFDALERDEAWIYLDDLLVAVNPAEPVEIRYQEEGSEQLEIEFQKHIGSGIVRINADDRVLGKLDLYSSDWESMIFNASLGTVSPMSNPGLFLILYITFFFIISVLPGALCIMKRDNKYIKYSLSLLFMCVIMAFGDVIYYKSNISATKELGFFCILMVLSWVISIKMSCYMKNHHNKKWDVMGYNICVCLFSALILFYVSERINRNIGNITVKYTIANAGIYLAIILLIYMLIRRVALSVVISSAIVYMYAVVNYYVTLFRGTPIVPGDFFLFGTVKNVFMNYTYTINYDMFFSALVVISWLIILGLSGIYIRRSSRLEVIRVTFPLAILIGCIISSDFYAPVLDLWNLNNNIKTYGVAVSLVSNIRSMRVLPPEEYSHDEVEKLYEEYKSEREPDRVNPNVIVIMNESFSDLSVVSDVVNSDAYMPYYNSLVDNVVKGEALVSTIGGGTANTEYEFLTGNSMAFIPGTVPYQQFVVKNANSLGRIFKEKGYYVSAIHPYDKVGYNRQRVYPYFGFDEFLSIDDFVKPELSRNLYATDAESYKKVIDVFEQCKKNNQLSFIFNVTIQNHSGYTTGYFGDNTVKIPGYENKFSDVEEYLTLIKESDEALKVLFNYFASIEDPTVILIFGDHQPKVDFEFYEAMLGKPRTEWTLEETQKLYKIPFMIWANYDIKEKANVFTSMNYLAGIFLDTAGIQTTPYQSFLLKLKETIPAMNINGYLGDDGIWHMYSEETKYSPILTDYWNIQYNNMFDKKKVDKWFAVN